MNAANWSSKTKKNENNRPSAYEAVREREKF